MYLYWLNLLLMLLCLGCTTNQRSIQFGFLLHLLVQGHQESCILFLKSLHFLPRVLKAQKSVQQDSHSWRSWWIKRQSVRRYHNFQCRDILVGLLEDFHTWDYFPQLLKYQDFWNISTQIQGILLYMKLCSRVIMTYSMWLIFFLCHVVEESEMVCCFNCS